MEMVCIGKTQRPNLRIRKHGNQIKIGQTGNGNQKYLNEQRTICMNSKLN